MKKHPFPKRRFAIAVSVIGGLAAFLASHDTPPISTAEAAACGHVGTWIAPGEPEQVIPGDAATTQLALSRVVLLGESHDNADHHRWQAQVLAGLMGQRTDMVLAFEMFPRPAQPVLDDWVAGKLNERQFLEQTKWATTWGFDPDMYMPMFQLARVNGLPMVAANIPRTLVRSVSRDGWKNVPESERHGVSTPAAPSRAYRESLARVYAVKLAAGTYGHETENSDKEKPAPDLAEVMELPAFQRFVEAQLTWDRAMAEAIADAARRHPDALIAGIVGRGHAEYGHGIPHQLRDLGIEKIAVALPVPAEACAKLPAEIADLAFVLPKPPAPPPAAPPKPKLGVMIEKAEGGVKVGRVLSESIAAAAGIKADDVIIEAAGKPTAKTTDLIAVIQRQAPGTWLPLKVRRGSETVEVVAKFPAAKSAP